MCESTALRALRPRAKPLLLLLLLLLSPAPLVTVPTRVVTPIAVLPLPLFKVEVERVATPIVPQLLLELDVEVGAKQRHASSASVAAT